MHAAEREERGGRGQREEMRGWQEGEKWGNKGRESGQKRRK